MYLSADDARSDFFLAAAVYVIGPTLISLLVQAVPGLLRNAVIAVALSVLFNFLTTAAMPLYLLRYREESFAALRTGSASSLVSGLGLGAVFAAAVAVGEVLSGGLLVGAGNTVALTLLAGVVVRWMSLAVLAVFLHRRAEYAFRPISESQRTLTHQAGLACVGTAVVSTVLLLLDGRPLGSVLAAAGLAGMFLLAERQLPQEGVGERWWVWAPVITLALGPLEILGFLGGGAGFLLSAQQASVVALFGLVAVMALHRGRGALFVFGMAVAMIAAQTLQYISGSVSFLF